MVLVLWLTSLRVHLLEVLELAGFCRAVDQVLLLLEFELHILCQPGGVRAVVRLLRR